MILSGRYTLPLSTRRNDSGQVTAWTATLNGSYGRFGNEGMARTLNPDEVWNGSLNISHVSPLSEKWSILASLGCGVYAEPREITLKSILANGAAVFIYRLKDNLHIGFGAGLTNSYGIPMVLPMGYFSWQSSGKYEIRVNMLNGMRVSASTWIGRNIRMELVAIEMDGLSAVMKVEGKSKIYSTMTMKSYISPSFHLSKRTSVYMGIGGNWMRSISLSDRSIKGFFSNFSSKDNEPNLFNISLRLTAGLRYGF